jgi:hypothetical protein
MDAERIEADEALWEQPKRRSELFLANAAEKGIDYFRQVGYHGIIADYERYYPELWRKVYPRIYQEPGNYWSTKIPAMDLMGAVVKRFLPNYGKAELYEFLVASQLTRFHVPTYLISKPLAEAIRQTECPLDLRWPSLEMPHKACVFMLPKGTLRHAKFGESAYVAYARFKEGESPISPLDGRPFGTLNDSLTFLVGCFESPNLMVLHHNLDGDANPTISLGHLEEAVRQGNDDTNLRLYAGLDEDDRQLIQQTMHYVFNTLMVMLFRPQLVERGRASGKKSKRGA